MIIRFSTPRGLELGLKFCYGAGNVFVSFTPGLTPGAIDISPFQGDGFCFTMACIEMVLTFCICIVGLDFSMH